MTVAPPAAPASSVAGKSVPAIAWRALLAVTGVFTAVLLATSGGYGYYLDELYFRVAGNHLAWGYVDQPPLVALLARAQTALFGDTLVALRVAPALLAGASVLVAGLIARELGGARGAQLLAATAAAVSLAGVAAGHVLHPTAVDHVVWITAAWLVVRLVRTGDTRLWLAFGAVVGIGLLAKYLVVLLVLGLLVGLLVSGPRSVLAGRNLLLGAGIGLLLGLPALLWQAANGWPQFTMASELSADPGLGAAINLVIGQVLLVGPPLAALLVVGIVGVLRRQAWRPYRALVWAYLVAGAVLVAVGGQPRYLVALSVVLVAAGAVVAADWARTGLRKGLLVLALAANAVFAAVVLLPLLPVELYADTPVLSDLGAGQLEQHGWPEAVDQVAAVYRALPPAEQQAAIVYGGNYSEAGAVDRYGPERGLPPVYSGHNSYADFGTPTDDKTTVIAFGVDRDTFTALFDRCETAARFSFELPQPEQDKEIVVCHGPREPWSATWPRLRWLGTF